jgi:hypothetical protein
MFWSMLNYISKIVQQCKHQTYMYYLLCINIKSCFMYFEPLVIVVLKETKFICMSYIIINP